MQDFRVILSVFCILIQLLTLQVHAESETIRIGAISSLTGPAAEQGRSWLNGALLAARDIRANNNLNVEVIVEDDTTLPANAASAFKKLITINKAQAIIGGTWDFTAEGLAPLVLRYKIPFITPTNPIEALSNSAQHTPQYFTNGLSIHATEESMRAVLRKLSPTTISIVVPNVPFGLLHAAAVKKIAAQLKIKIVSRLDFELAGYQDTLKSAAIKITKLAPDIIFCLTDHATLDIFNNELHRSHYKGTILTTQHLAEAALMSRDFKRWRNFIGFYPNINSEEFRIHYYNEYKSEPKVYAAEGYDALLFLALALHKKIDLSQQTFEATGFTGQLKSWPGNSEISHLEAIPMVINSELKLVPYFQ